MADQPVAPRPALLPNGQPIPELGPNGTIFPTYGSYGFTPSNDPLLMQPILHSRGKDPFTGAWTGQTLTPHYSRGPTASSLPAFSQAGGRATPPVHAVPPPSNLSIVSSQMIKPPAKDKKKKGRERLTDALVALPPPIYQDPFLPPGAI